MNDRALAVIDESPPRALARVDQEMGLEVDAIAARVEKVHAVSKRLMKQGHHYGIVPGTKDKMALFKPGAELLTLTFQLDPQFALDERRDPDGHFECIVTCTLYHAPSGRRLGSGVGSCSTRESKYAWRKAERTCPTCGSSAIIKGQEKYGGGWICYDKKGGCRAKFRDDDKRITEQQVGRIPNPDLADTYNTVRKMGCKRAHVAAVLFVTCASELFTQDLEEDVEMGGGHSYEERDPHPRGEAPGAHSPHDDGADYSDASSEAFNRLVAMVAHAEDLANKCSSYENVLELEEYLGSRAKQSELTKAIQAAKEARSITPEQHKILSAKWHHLYRELTKEKPPGLKARYPAPDATASFVDADPEDDGR